MSATELLFLALGLCVGVAVGAALLDLIRARPAPREVRLTITRNALPARGATLAAAGPAIDPVGGSDVERRVPIQVARGVDPAYAAIDQVPEAALVGVAAGAAARPDGGSASQGGQTMVASGEGGPASAEPSAGGASSGALGEGPAAMTAGRGAPQGTVGDPSLGPATWQGGSDPCANQRRLVDERCTIAASAREQADAAAASVRLARRSYDDVARRMEEAQVRSDPRNVVDGKELARRTFRAARDRAGSRADLELATTVWLTEINRINLEVRDATKLIAREQADAAALLASIERQALDADAARITAEAAGEACHEARIALAACEGGDLAATAVTATAAPAVVEWAEGVLWDREDGRQPEIVRLLRGEPATRERLIAQLAGNDADEQRRYQLWLSELVDAIFAASIEVAALDFPAEHPFWSGFDRTQSRDIVIALASLGYRFDGFGGFSAERVPSQRELSLAVGYAALDPMRIRTWPSAAEMPDLFQGVTVAADEFLATRAPALELPEMVAVLGRRSESLSELWNRWGRLRPLLVAAVD